MSKYDRASVRTESCEIQPEQRVLRFPHLLGGMPKFQKLPASNRLQFLQKGHALGQFPQLQRVITITPDSPARNEEFSIGISKRSFHKTEKIIAFVRLEVRMPSGSIHRLEFMPDQVEQSQDEVIVRGFSSQDAGDLYVSVRIYFSDGSTVSDARTALVLSRNPDFMVITPMVWLVSHNAGRVEFDWDTNDFHCRAYANVTNGSNVRRTYTTCSVNIWDGNVGGALYKSFSFPVAPFSTDPGGTTYQVIDTWFAEGDIIWEKFNLRWDFTFEFTYTATDGTMVTSSAVYRPMSAVLINLIETTEFTSNQIIALSNALQVATEILEARDITLLDPAWRIISDPNNRARFRTIDIGWTDGKHDYSEGGDMYEVISGPGQDRLDVFIPLAIGYRKEVPENERNVLGFSTVNGPFPKDSDYRNSGSLVLMAEYDHEFFGVALAHEICHYLSLPHVTAEDNLMEEHGGLSGHNLTIDQWNQAKGHFMVKWYATDI